MLHVILWGQTPAVGFLSACLIFWWLSVSVVGGWWCRTDTALTATRTTFCPKQSRVWSLRGLTNTTQSMAQTFSFWLFWWTFQVDKLQTEEKHSKTFWKKSNTGIGFALSILVVALEDLVLFRSNKRSVSEKSVVSSDLPFLIQAIKVLTRQWRRYFNGPKITWVQDCAFGIGYHDDFAMALISLHTGASLHI